MNGSSLCGIFNYFWHFMVFPLWFVILYVTASKDKHVAAVVLSSSSILIISCMGFKGTLVVFYLWSLKPYFSIVIILLRGEGEWFPRCTSNKQSCALRHKSLSGELWESFGSWNRADNMLQQTSCFLDAQIWLLTVFLLRRCCLALSVTVRSSDSTYLKKTQLSLFSILLLNKDCLFR